VKKQTPKTEGDTPPYDNTLMIHFDWGGAEKVVTLLTTFLKRKTVFAA
jgi:hypothetical protein